ncbi:NAD(P)H-dependent oxidoreductase [Bartonella sp. HY329]|uniref:NADPH-dependent FMN reductase n=1 Tax=unclassified Bartonella TaxID=2645622 RepID=UPI0021C78C84|nr:MULTISPECIES: NAD(P)H-dependent oxidoreductase [unclassified Bartonella]UXM96125.1 NAD(P)H-dependent oxidoreductase [Bartonella sp. HY329]UXN10449.1 NAD(P)H-dependent oxidoreductase [Bartonella sp. HY328]
MTKPVLQIIITTTRPGRKGPALAQWLLQHAHADSRFDVELVDIAALNLPLFDEPNHPRLGQYTKNHTKYWSNIAARGDAYIFVIPEYDHLPPSSFINAITYLCNEWAYKSVAFLSYGGVSGGTRAAEAARQMLTAVRMYPILDTIAVPNYYENLGDDGSFTGNNLIEKSVKSVLDELHKVEQGLKIIRNLDKN